MITVVKSEGKVGEKSKNSKDRPVKRVEPMAHAGRMGVTIYDENCIYINIWKPGATSLKMNLYRENHVVQHISIPSLGNVGMSDFFSARLYGEGIASAFDELCYDFVSDGEHFIDETAEILCGRENFGKRGRIRARLANPEFDWTGEKRVIIDTKDMVMYEAHVRGFTRHASSGVANPGTFDGMREKLPYLKELGINTIFLLPVYEFDELSIPESSTDEKRVNYWGYTRKAYYMAPKAAYSSDKLHPDREFKTLIKEIHRHGMNVVMDMFFNGQSPDYVLECLRHYAIYYHVDGFRVISQKFDVNQLREDAILSHVRFFGFSWEDKPDDHEHPMLFEMNDGFKEVARRYVKSDEGQVESFFRCFRAERNGVGKVNYITAHDGFTLRDLISYDVKHNEANGEKNRDGTDYNYSWNCGVEGVTRRKSVLRIRDKQEKNILVMLLLGLPIPMILMGDEFGNSQKGNNNAYCIDNQTTWLDWRLLDKNRETYEFVRKLLKLRLELPIYHRKDMYTGFDHKGYGAPDISNHGREPWNHIYPYYCRELGVLFYGPYLEDDDGRSYYFAFNMHWEPHDFYLPDITRDRQWRVILDTASGVRKDEGLNEDRTAYRVEGRSIILLSCEKDKPRRKKNDRTSDRKHKRVSKPSPGGE